MFKIDYDSILKRFLGQSDYREWMKTPFNSGGKTFSTDGDVMVVVPLQDDYEDQTEKIKNVYPVEKNMDMPISVLELRTKLDLFPKVDCFDEVISECDACHGSGNVEFEFEHSYKTYYLDGDCPICDGDGKLEKASETPSGKKEFDYTKYFQIGNSAFNLNKIEDLLFVASETGIETIKLVKQTKKSASSLFEIGEVELLVMPVLFHPEDVLQSINKQ